MFFSGCISQTRGIIYDATHQLALDVYAPRSTTSKKPVLVFVHGGNWRSGKRSTYKFFGKGFARKGVVSVVIDYRLNNVTDYRGMTMDVARAVKWVKENSAAFGGDSTRIFLSGHSSGGHLVALAANDSSYFNALRTVNPVKGLVLIDAFGLDMYTYLKSSQNREDSIYIPTFSNDPVTWKKASPIYHLDKHSPPCLVFVGERTYPAIKIYSREFLQALKPYRSDSRLIEVKRKKHVPMIGQFYNPANKRYTDILEFIRQP